MRGYYGFLYSIFFVINISITCSKRIKSFTEVSGMINDYSQYPIFSVSEDLEKVLQSLRDKNGNNTNRNIMEYDIELLYLKYLNNLRDYYKDRFDIAIKGNSMNFNMWRNLEKELLTELNIAIRSSTPISMVDKWSSYSSSIIQELRQDIDDTINLITTNINDNYGSSAGLGSQEDNNNYNNYDNKGLNKFKYETRMRIRSWLQTKWGKRTKWITTRALLFGFNMLQFEWQRKQKVRQCDLRLAEIPEFPLL